MSKVIAALEWWKENNKLYKDIIIDDHSIIAPKIIDLSITEESSNNNIKNEIEFTAVFTNPNPPSADNGGYATNRDMKNDVINQDILRNDDSKDDTSNSTNNNSDSDNNDSEEDFIFNNPHYLLCKPTKNILKDYEKDSLLKAFPMHFPFGVGTYDGHVDKFYEYLNDLLPPYFHIAEFVTIIHNMWERKRMFQQSCLHTSTKEKMNIADITDAEIERYLENYANKIKDYDSPGYRFVQKIKSCTGSMAHTRAATKKIGSKFCRWLPILVYLRSC